ncbi:MAG: MarR family transcriptional regulator [Ignavibacteriales bacterium]|nr:MAG: MarR family transcriptional regulator [Ignavibacteriales bacterium]
MSIEEEISQEHFRNKHHKSAVNVIYTFNWLYEKTMELLKPFGLTIQQFNILRILRGQHPEPATVKLLKERMMDKMSDASRLVEKLRKKGLVDRRICDKDRRNVDVLITEEGLLLLKNIDSHEKEFDKIMANLSSEEMDQLNDLLDKLRG